MNAHRDGPGSEGPEREPTELVVAPTRIGGGRRAAARGVIAAVAASLFLVLAIWKPWVGGPDGPRASQAIADRASPSGPSGSASPVGSAASPAGPILDDYGPFPSTETLLAAATHEPVWGVRALVQRPGGPIFTGRQNVVERWFAVDAATVEGSAAPAPLAIAQPDDEVAAIGVTTADDALPLDVRFWRERADGPPDRLAPVAVAGPDAGSWVWLADPTHATDRGTWGAGRYDIEVLLGPRIVRLVVTIPTSAPTTPQPAPPQFRPQRGVILAALGPGPFALTGGGAIPIVGGSPPLADEREAWLGPAAGLTSVAVVPSADVTGFGFLAGPGETPVRVEVASVIPAAGPSATDSAVVDALPGGRSAAIVLAANGGRFPDGLYVVTATSTSGGPEITASWWVEIAPTIPQSPPASPLKAMGRWVGLLDQPVNGARQPLVFIADPAGSTDECAPSTLITGSDPLLGIAVPPDVTVTHLRMLPLDVVRSADIAIRYAPVAIPGLTVVALPPGGLPVRDYDLFLTLVTPDGETRIAQRICVSRP